MKLMFLTDSHVTFKGPESRIDSYHNVILDKFGEVGEIIREKGIDRVIHGGDLFHSYNISLKFAGEIANAIRTWRVPVSVVPGNHDVIGYNTKTLEQTMLGFLANTGVVRLLLRSNPLMFNIKGKMLAIEGQEYYKDIDTGNKDDYMCQVKADLNLLVAHSMLLERPFFKDKPHTLIKDVHSNADIILTGHYHPGFKTVKIDNTTFINPGSLLRNESSDKHMPKVIIININDDTFEYTIEEIPLKCAKPRELVFDLSKKEFKENTERFLEEFKENIREITENTNGDITKDLLELTAKDSKVTNEIKDLAYDWLQDTQASDESELKGYVKKDHEIKIKSIDIKNFQSHVDTHLDFDEGFNCIIGRNGKGKSSIVRAIGWCVSNNIKGDYFITTGEEECSVKITLSDNSSIERYRSRKNAGGYRVTTYWGELLELKGFGNDVPIDVINEHQMPFVKLAKGLIKILNISEQSENTFLIQESPSIKASAVGKIVGNDNIDLTIKNVSAKITSLSKDIKSTKKNIKDKKEELKEYNNLGELEDKINKIDDLMEKYNAVKKEIDTLKGFKVYKQRIDNDRNILNQKMHELNKFDTENISEKIDYLNNVLFTELYDAIRYQELVEGYKRIRHNLNTSLNNMPNVDKLESKVLEYDLILEELIETNEFRDRRIAIYKPKVEVNKNVNALAKEEESLTKEKIVEENNLKAFLKENEVCPTCNEVLDLEKIEFIVNN